MKIPDYLLGIQPTQGKEIKLDLTTHTIDKHCKSKINCKKL